MKSAFSFRNRKNRKPRGFVTVGVILCLSVVLIAAKTSKPPRHPQQLSYPELQWNVPLGTNYRQVLDNGMVAYIAEDHQLPLVEITGHVKAGSLFDPQGKEGLGSLTTTLLRTGGTQEFSAETLDALIDLYALQIGFSLKESILEFKAVFLADYTDNALEILEQMLYHPTFEEERFTKEKTTFLQRIRHRFDTPQPILAVAYEKAMYPNGSNSRIPTKESVESITRDDCIGYHKGLFSSENIILAVSGDFDTKEMSSKLAKMFPKAQAIGDSISVSITPRPESRGILVDKDISQAYIRMGLPFVQRPHPDYYPMSVLNLILGGSGFTSRLGQKIRSDEGLTYSIHSQAGSNYTYPATIYISFHTKTESASRAVDLSLKEIQRLREEGITDEELANAKATLIDGFPSMFRSPTDIVTTYAWSEYYGRSEDHFKVYPEKIDALTKKEVEEVARKYLHPDSLTYVVVGPADEILKQNDGFSFDSLSPRRTISPDSLTGMQ